MKTNRLSVLCLAGALLLTGVSFTSCLKGDDVDTNQYVGGISLNVFGPSPVARGGELRLQQHLRMVIISKESAGFM